MSNGMSKHVEATGEDKFFATVADILCGRGQQEELELLRTADVELRRCEDECPDEDGYEPMEIRLFMSAKAFGACDEKKRNRIARNIDVAANEVLSSMDVKRFVHRVQILVAISNTPKWREHSAKLLEEMAEEARKKNPYGGWADDELPF